MDQMIERLAGTEFYYFLNEFSKTLKKKLTEAPILVVPDWNLPFELMCDASDFTIGAVLRQGKMKHFRPIHYASKTMTEAQIHYTTTEKEMLAVVIDPTCPEDSRGTDKQKSQENGQNRTNTNTGNGRAQKRQEKDIKIDPKDKGKKRIEEEDQSDTESEGITEAEKKFKQLANDEEVARKVQEEWEAEEEKKRLAEEEDTKAGLSNEYDFIQHVRGKKHSDLKTKSFDEIQVLYEKIKRREKKDDSVKGEIKEEEGTRRRKLGKRKKMKSKKRKFTSKDDEELRLCLTIAPDEDKEVDYEILEKKYPIIEWRSEYLTTKQQYDETKEVEDVYLNVVIRSNRQRRYFSTLMAVFSILDRDDICPIYQLVMNRYQDETPEGFNKILWGDLMIMFNQSDNDEFWNAQQSWKIVSWKLHSSSGAHTIMTDEGLVIHMLVENKYPLEKEVLS
ncbi:reverse transcriptase domain-containing protein [Tanacetum coccineum]